MPPKVKVFITREIPSSGIDLLIQEGFDVSVWPHDRPMSAEEMVREIKNANALISLSTDTLNNQMLRECKHLDLISQFSAGYDNIDIAEATRLGIPVGNAPKAMSEATADIAFGLMIAVARKMFYMHKTILDGEWKHFKPKAHLGIELRHKTLGVFGLGNIGSEMARKCKGAYDMEIIYCNRKPNAAAEKLFGARRVSFTELLKSSDVLSVHCALNEETKGVFNRNAFEQMKHTAIFINTARGPVHSEKDLVEALISGKIMGAGLDVTDPEPMRSDHPLLAMENVAILPHIGSATIEARNEMSRQAAVNIIEYYKTGNIPNLINPRYSEARKLDSHTT